MSKLSTIKANGDMPYTIYYYAFLDEAMTSKMNVAFNRTSDEGTADFN